MTYRCNISQREALDTIPNRNRVPGSVGDKFLLIAITFMEHFKESVRSFSSTNALEILITNSLSIF